MLKVGDKVRYLGKCDNGIPVELIKVGDKGTISALNCDKVATIDLEVGRQYMVLVRDLELVTKLSYKEDNLSIWESVTQ